MLSPGKSATKLYVHVKLDGYRAGCLGELNSPRFLPELVYVKLHPPCGEGVPGTEYSAIRNHFVLES